MNLLQTVRAELITISLPVVRLHYEGKSFALACLTMRMGKDIPYVAISFRRDKKEKGLRRWDKAVLSEKEAPAWLCIYGGIKLPKAKEIITALINRWKGVYGTRNVASETTSQHGKGLPRLEGTYETEIQGRTS